MSGRSKFDGGVAAGRQADKKLWSSESGPLQLQGTHDGHADMECPCHGRSAELVAFSEALHCGNRVSHHNLLCVQCGGRGQHSLAPSLIAWAAWCMGAAC